MRQFLLATALVTFALIGLGTAASAVESAPATAIVIKDAWLRATPNGAKVAGGYVTITNAGSAPDTLVAAGIAVAPKGEIHTMSVENGVMHMGRLENGLAIAPGETVTLQPGGNHLMFLNPTAPIKEGASVAGSLTFAKAGTMAVTFTVGAMGAKMAPGTMNHGSMGSMGMKP